jgi:hypothetical protein
VGLGPPLPQIVLSYSLMSSRKTTIYPNLTTNSLILEKEEGEEFLCFFRKKERAKNLPIGVARPGHGKGGRGDDLIL